VIHRSLGGLPECDGSRLEQQAAESNNQCFATFEKPYLQRKATIKELRGA